MKKQIFQTVFAVAILSLTLTSCYIDNEPNYDPATRVTGTYWVEEYSHTFDEYTEYQIRIYQRGYGNVVITNFYGVSIDVYAEVRGNTLYIPFQVRDGYEIEGRAAVIGGSLDFTYTVRDTYNSHWVRNVCDADAWIY
jgi:hypothetical protein